MSKYNFTILASAALLVLIAITSCSHHVAKPSPSNLVQWITPTDNPLHTYSNINLKEAEQAPKADIDEMPEFMEEYTREITAYLHSLQLPMVIGTINSSFKAQFIEASAVSNRIAIMSSGGDSRIAVELAEYIYEKGDIELIVFVTCQSACVESLLPAAASVVLFDSPFLGVHGNVISMEHLVHNGTSDPCPNPLSQENLQSDLKSLADRMRWIYQQTNHNENFWKSQFEILGQPKFSYFLKGKDLKGEDSCIMYQDFEYTYWYPTTEQFSNLMGLKLKGKLCSDSQECYQNRIGFTEDVGSKVVMGSEELVIKEKQYFKYNSK